MAQNYTMEYDPDTGVMKRVPKKPKKRVISNADAAKKNRAGKKVSGGSRERMTPGTAIKRRNEELNKLLKQQ